MDKEILKEKFNVGKVLKAVVESTFKEVNNLLKNDDEQTLKTLRSFQEVLKRKLTAIKTLEDEIISIINNPAEIEQIITESTTFEIHSKAQLNLIQKHLNNSLKLENNARTSKWKDTVKLPKLEIAKFDGDLTKWQPFIDSFNTAIEWSGTLSDVKKFNYLRCFLDGEASHAISGLSLTNENNKEVLDLLKNRYRNPQLIVSAHMSALVKLAKVQSDNVRGLRKFYDDVKSNVRSLRNLGIDSKSYGSLLSTLIIEKLPQNIKLIISRKIETDIWDLTKVLHLISLELRARETCVVPNQLSLSMDGKNKIVDDLFTGSSLNVIGNSRSSRRSNAFKCVFCKGFHWSDKCRVITDPEDRKEFLRKGKRCFLCLNVDHVSRNCTKSKSCF